MKKENELIVYIVNCFLVDMIVEVKGFVDVKICYVMENNYMVIYLMYVVFY